MKRTVLIGVCVALTFGSRVSAFGAQPVSGTGSSSRYDYSFVKGMQPWLTVENPAGLSRLGENHLTHVGAFFRKENGEFCNYSDSPDAYVLGTDAQAFVRPGERFSVFGEVSYDYCSGKRMAGSAFSDPDLMPFNLVEDEANAGSKQRERYHLAGGFSYEAARAFSLGLKADYTAGNFVKTKDLRHSNHLLDLTAVAGLVWHPGSWSLGLDYRYRRRVETLSFQQSGESARSYSEQISYGAFYGRQQIFAANTYVSSESQPVCDQWHGGAFQLSYDLPDGAILLGEATACVRYGSYGVPGSKNAEYARHRGWESRLRATLRLPSGRLEHRARLELGYSTLTGRENVYRYVNDPATGNTVVDYLGDNVVSQRSVLDARALYELCLGTQGRLPEWTLSADLSGFRRETAVPLYPFWRWQQICSAGLGLDACRIFLWDLHQMRVGASLGFAAGGGTPAQDGCFLPSSEGLNVPSDNAVYRMREFEYWTCPQLWTGARLSYGYWLGRRYDVSIGLDVKWNHAFGTSAVGGDRLSFLLSWLLNF